MPRSNQAFGRAPDTKANPPMLQYDIGKKRASLYPAQRPRNGFCSTPGRQETTVVRLDRSKLRPKTGKGSDFDPYAMRIRIDVGLRKPNPERPNSAERRQPLEDGVSERLLEVPTT